MSIFSHLFKKKEESNLPQLIQDLKLRINGVINLKIGAESFLLLSDKMLVSQKNIDTVNIINKITIASDRAGFEVVRAFVSNGNIFQFNCPNGKFNDMMLLIPFSGNIRKQEITDEKNEIKRSIITNEIEFIEIADIELYYEFSSDNQKENSIEKLYMREIDSVIEYFLIRIISLKEQKKYIGVVINENDIEIV